MFLLFLLFGLFICSFPSKSPKIFYEVSHSSTLCSLENTFVLEQIKHQERSKNFKLRTATDTVNHVVCLSEQESLELPSPWQVHPGKVPESVFSFCKAPFMVP